MLQLLRLDEVTLINIKKVLQITVRNLDVVRRERRQNVITPEQRDRQDGRIWEVSVYFRSDNDEGYNPQRYVRRFKTMKEADNWINQKFSNYVI